MATSDTLLVWLTTQRTGVRVFRVPISRQALATVVEAYRNSIGATAAGMTARLRGTAGTRGLRSRRSGIPNRADQKIADSLSSIVLPSDLRTELSDGDAIVLIPQGPLQLIPFAALPDAGGQALGTRFALRYAPSVMSVIGLDFRASSSSDRTDWSDALVVGDPYMPSPLDDAGVPRRLARLPGARDEAAAVGRLLGADVVSGRAATETAVLARIGTSPLLHFATHGMAFSEFERSVSSFVALAPDSGADGLLTVEEIMARPPGTVRARLVTLSGCQTGLGSLLQGEGLIGLQRAFLSRGAEALLVSLWSVDDEATRLLMEAFYSHWLRDEDRPSKAEALRRAQMALRDTPGFEAPLYWAPFQLIGAN